MKKFAVAAALLSAALASPALANEGRAEVRGGYVTGSGLDDATIGAAVGYDFDLGATTFVGAEAAVDKVLIDGADAQLSAGGRIGAKLGTGGKLYATGGYTFTDIEDPYVGAGYQHQLGQNLYGKVEYRHQFVENFGDFDTFAVGVGVAF